MEHITIRFKFFSKELNKLLLDIHKELTKQDRIYLRNLSDIVHYYGEQEAEDAYQELKHSIITS